MRTSIRLIASLFAFGLVVAVAAPAGGAVPQAASHSLIEGSGSSWAANAINQWIADVHSNGLQVVYDPSGSAQGRIDYANKTVDFAVSDIGYQGVDPVTGASDTSGGRGYAYLPIVAGGTSFPYQLRVNGQLVRNLRLSGATIAGIFTNKITNWDSPLIKKDNPGTNFPNLPIIPVVHSEGSGDTAQFTRWLATDFASLWDPFGGRTFTEYFPRAGAQVAENGSDSVMNYITSNAANGSIGYNEYSYALGANYPVAKVLNKAGYYTLPNQYNVAVALQKAQINYDKGSADYLLENLDKTYVDPAVQTYPLSSYSYMIIPTSGTDARMTTSKRQTLADYLYYSICQGQKEMGPIGYSPLPVNLVEAGFKQVGLLHTADSAVDLTKENVTTCDNPTFVSGHPTENYLAKIAPKPPACDKYGHIPCAATTDTTGNPKGGKAPNPTKTSGPDPTQTNPSTSPTSPSGKGGGSSPPGSNPSNNPNPSGTSPTGTAPGSTQTCDPSTGQCTTGGATNASSGQVATSLETTQPAQSGGLNTVLAVLAGLLLICLLLLPPVLWQRFADRRGSQ